MNWLLSLIRRLLGQVTEGVPPSGVQESPSPPTGPILVAPLPAGQPAAQRHINKAGYEMVKQFEGLVLTAYNDGTGTLTIGYGHTAGVYPGQVITPTTAEAYLEQDLGRAEGIVATLAPPGLTDNQFSALVDFTFNLGPGALQQMLAHGVDQVPVQMLRWDHEGPVVVPGLARRRQAEVDLWQSA